jgi:hypothetical protein
MSNLALPRSVHRAAPSAPQHIGQPFVCDGTRQVVDAKSEAVGTLIAATKNKRFGLYVVKHMTTRGVRVGVARGSIQSVPAPSTCDVQKKNDPHPRAVAALTAPGIEETIEPR